MNAERPARGERGKLGPRVSRGLFAVAAAVSLVWFLFLGVYILFGDKRREDGAFLLTLGDGYNLTTLLYTLGAVLAAVCLCAVWLRAVRQFGLSARLARLVPYGLCLGYVLYWIVKTPFSPHHDAGDVLEFLRLMLAGEATEYMSAYLNFYATNKIALYGYYALARLIGDHIVAVRLLNGLMLAGALVLTALSSRRLLGERGELIALILGTMLGPYMLLTGPYIYLPGLFLAALMFWLYLVPRRGATLAAFLLCGVLYIIRPLALAPFLVYFCVTFFHRLVHCREIRAVCIQAGVLLACLFGVQAVLGGVFYATGLHTYPGLQNSAMVWTMELGTRFDPPEQVGISTYSAYGDDYPQDDEVADAFHELWALYRLDDPANAGAISDLHGEIRSMLWDRTRSTVLDSPGTAGRFLRGKFCNLLADRYVAYYYFPHVSNAGVSDEIYQNYQEKYFTQLNALYLLLSAGCAAVSFGLLRRRLRVTGRDAALVGLAVGCMAMMFCCILLTEVAKKYILDLYVPVMVIAAGALAPLAERAEGLSPRRAAAAAAISAVLGLGLFGYGGGRYNFSMLKGAQYQVEDGVLYITGVTVEEGWELRPGSGQTIQWEGDTAVITLNDYAYTAVAFTVVTPDGTVRTVYQ